jgi:hypothetical protein
MQEFSESNGSQASDRGGPDIPFGDTRSGRLVAWGNALLGGFAAPDDVADAVRGSDTRHLVREADGEVSGLTLALGRLRGRGVTGLRLALPVPGHPLGLSGPAGFNTSAIEAGEAIVAVGAPVGASVGFVPEVRWHGAGESEEDGISEVVWHCSEVRDAPPADVPALADAERELLEAMRDATETLLRLDVAGGAGGHEVRAALRGGSEGGDDDQVLAPGYSARAARVLERARRVAALIAIARRGDGAAVSAGEMAMRDTALLPVERAARRAIVSAHNSFVDGKG